MGFFKNLFNNKQEPEFDLEKAVGAYLLKLPRCNKDVVIVDPKYGDTHYTCKIKVAAADLLPWAEDHAANVCSSDKEEQAARKALPLWLRGAQSSIDSASFLPHLMYEVLKVHILDFVRNGTAKTFCLECQSIVADVQIEKINKKGGGDWAWWTDVWKCPQGHQLYYQEHELRLHVHR